ncbi:restriction endonuclease subunit S [Halovibrio sp. HP20-50]|uniref:restriction endonuclease subunit S n=1 Tax=Halovibrio sp. HP20-59 TaxID=3080275 RepID=UPI00294AC99E|nr:restriction endonuclease subunit S [Halovibrio sp. HP20-59]MEA2118978.1 restriction endonuclease subunit S [Halovibrio sp. HP20-59]
MNVAAYPKYESYKHTSIKWSPEIPKHWDIMPLKSMAGLKSGDTITAEQFTSDGFPVYGGNGFRGFTDRKTHTGNFVLIGRQGALCGNVNYAHDDFFATEHAIVVSPKKSLETIWLGEAIRCADFNQLSQSAAQPGISTEVIGNQRFPFPPLPEQRAIAAFLDGKCAKIDEAVRIKEEQIKLLRERRQILIQEAVTRGLNPDVPMKNSGIDWIGEIPAHWEVRRGKYLFREVNERSESGNEELLSVSHTSGVTPRSEKNVNMFLAEDYTGSKLCRPGDIVINTMWAWMGALGVSDLRGIISPSYGVYRSLQKGAFNRRFLEWLLRTTPFIEQYNKISTGLHSSRLRLYPHMFLGMPIAFPNRDEQDSIVTHVEVEAEKIDKAISIKQDQITTLKEYKTSLINSAVTGKIKVI